jgi:hypothetical protein
MPGSVWSGSAPAAGGTPGASAIAGTPFTAVICIAVSMDGLRKLAFLAAVGARGSPSCTRTVCPVDPVGLDALRLELLAACIAIKDTHGPSSMIALWNAPGVQVLEQATPVLNPPSSQAPPCRCTARCRLHQPGDRRRTLPGRRMGPVQDGLRPLPEATPGYP